MTVNRKAGYRNGHMNMAVLDYFLQVQYNLGVLSLRIYLGFDLQILVLASLCLLNQRFDQRRYLFGYF